MSSTKDFDHIFSADVLLDLFPASRSNEFFEALFGDAEEGAYDIALNYRGAGDGKLTFELQLHQRPGCCLACNLTHGLPQVFSRHPVINIGGLVEKIDGLLGDDTSCGEWALGYTEQQSSAMHIVPLTIHYN